LPFLDSASATRLSGLLFFQITALLVYLICKLWFSEKSGIYALIFFELTPFGLKFGHAPLIEFASISFLLSGVYFISKLRKNESNLKTSIVIFGSLLLVTLGTLTKVTTAVALLPLLLISFRKRLIESRGILQKINEFLIYSIFIIVPVFLVMSWNHFADAQKGLNPLANYLKSGSPQMVKWNFGTLEQRLSINTWRDILFQFLGPICLGIIFLGCLSVIQFSNRAYRKIYFYIFGLIFFPMIIFTNLYASHEYYVAAIFPLIVILMGTSIEQFEVKISKLSKYAGLVMCLFVIVGTFNTKVGLNYLGSVINHGTPPPLAAEIRANTPKDSLVAYFGCDWNPEIPFYSGRRALMIPEWGISPNLKDLKAIRYVVFCDFVPVNREITFQKFFLFQPTPVQVSTNIYKVNTVDITD
jgi:4-amino-4-deoxy-L-arabinose transferase-like glycosyltransferase